MDQGSTEVHFLTEAEDFDLKFTEAEAEAEEQNLAEAEEFRNFS